jgi:hypothetical protein
MTNVAVFALVIAGGWLTVSVNVCVAFGRTPFAAVNVTMWAPPVPAAGVPLNVPVPSGLATKVTPAGNVPLTASVGVGVPIELTVKVPGDPTVNVVVFALVMVGAPLIVSVKDCVAAGLTPLSAVNVSA